MNNNIKDYIVNWLKEYDDITMNGLQSHEEFNEISSGNFSWTVSGKNGEETNIVMMNNVSQKCIDSFIELIDNDIIKIKPTSLLVAMVEGKTLDAPLAKSIRNYKKPRWIPMLVEKSKNFKKY
jgi:hypothetical protein